MTDHRDPDSVFIRLLPDEADRAAAASRARHRAGRPLGPLDGVRIAVKDNIDVAGSPTTNGSVVDASAGPVERDAAVVRRSRDHGLVVVGKTNLSELAFSGLGTNPHFGTPANPLSTEEPLVTGGSSSGSAAAVAAGLVPLALGTDTSGSVRVPAAFCGVVGYKASEDLLPRDGVRTLSSTLDSIGILARTVDDLRILAAALGVPTSVDGGTVRLVVPEGDQVVEGCRPDVLSWFEEQVRRLERLDGVAVERRPVPVLREAQDLMAEHGTIVAADAHEEYGHLLDDPHGLDPDISRRLRAAASRVGTIGVVRSRMPVLRAQMARELDGAFLVCPTVRHGPPTVREVTASAEAFDRLNASTLATTMLLSYLGMPGVSLPSGRGRSAGYGLLVSGPRGADGRVLHTAGLIEEVALPGTRPADVRPQDLSRPA
ncbi:MAG TPA: amidase family protein [Nocardioides sp.]|nr:amidase family protein [Nocardioides sp.]